MMTKFKLSFLASSLMIASIFGACAQTPNKETGKPTGKGAPVATENKVPAKCNKSWGTTPADSVKAKENHTLYRDYFRAKKYSEAMPYWETAYSLAPYAQEKHSADGIEILKDAYNREADAAKKAELAKRVFSLYDNWCGCFGKEADLNGRKALDMINLKADALETYNTFKKSVSLWGDEKTPYYLLGSYAYVAAAIYDKGQITKEDMRSLYSQVNTIAEKQMAGKDSTNFKAAQTQAVTYLKGVKEPFFDCQYYVDQHKGTYKYEATKDNHDLRRTIKGQLKIGNCPETDAFYAMLLADDQKWGADNYEMNATLSMKAAKAQKEGRKGEAIELYLKAAEEEAGVSANDKAEWCYIAAHLAYDQNSYSNARSYARKALQYRPNWGDPYMLIGDLYAASTKSCGEGLEGRLAISAAIDKYIQAKNVDPSSADEANRRINKYSAYLPGGEELHERGLKSGSPWKVGCWIQESTIVRVK